MFLFQLFFVHLHKSLYFCNMIGEKDSSASGYIADSFEGIGREFTDVEILSTSEMNVVAKAKRYGRWWLLKGLNKQVANETAYQQRLRKEFELLMQLQHPGVVATIGLEDVDGIGNCIVMEYVEGQTLKAWLKTKHSRKERRRIAMQLAEAVAYIHSKGIVHRDLKPENIIVTHNGDNVKLIDFGLADTDSHTILKQPAGTQKYMSPEQRQTAVADVRNDIYSLGVVYSQMDLGFGPIIKKCLKPIDLRYQNISALQDDIRRRGRRRTILTGVALAALILVLAGIGLEKVMSLNDSLEQVTAAHEELLQKQHKQDEQRERIDHAIKEGKDIIDKALAAAGVGLHLDTLRNLDDLNMDVFNRIFDGSTAYNQYLARIRGEFTENEIAEIANVLIDYEGERTKKTMNRYNELKEAHDKAIMQGY